MVIGSRQKLSLAKPIEIYHENETMKEVDIQKLLGVLNK